MEYTLYIEGCDDETVLLLNLSATEIAFLQNLSRLSILKSNYGCQPTFRLEEGHIVEDED